MRLWAVDRDMRIVAPGCARIFDYLKAATVARWWAAALPGAGPTCRAPRPAPQRHTHDGGRGAPGLIGVLIGEGRGRVRGAAADTGARYRRRRWLPLVGASRKASEPVDETLLFLFNEYDTNKDGIMSRKEFFMVRSRPCCRPLALFYFSFVRSRRAHLGVLTRTGDMVPARSGDRAGSAVLVGTALLCRGKVQRGPNDPLLEQSRHAQRGQHHV